MDILTFLSNLIGTLTWPIIIVILFVIFKKDICELLGKISKIKHGDTEIEMEALDEQYIVLSNNNVNKYDQTVNVLISALMGGAHSFNWIRRNTSITLNDKEFNEFIENHKDIFKKVTIVNKDKDGRRIIPGNPGIKIQPNFRHQINQE